MADHPRAANPHLERAGREFEEWLKSSPEGGRANPGEIAKRDEREPRQKPKAEALEAGEAIQRMRDRLARCVSDLTRRDLSNLRRCAEILTLGIRGVVFDKDAADLLQEAMIRTYEGKRQWNPELTLVQHLKGCMRSIAHDWGKRAPTLIEYDDEDGSVIRTSVEREARISEEVIRKALANDAMALAILDLLMDGRKAAEICAALNLRDDVYKAARKRISRKVQGLMPQELTLKRNRKQLPVGNKEQK